jgi:hypothetical protein
MSRDPETPLTSSRPVGPLRPPSRSGEHPGIRHLGSASSTARRDHRRADGADRPRPSPRRRPPRQHPWRRVPRRPRAADGRTSAQTETAGARATRSAATETPPAHRSIRTARWPAASRRAKRGPPPAPQQSAGCRRPVRSASHSVPPMPLILSLQVTHPPEGLTCRPRGRPVRPMPGSRK